MPLPPWDGGITSLSLREIADEFGGPDPVSLSNYYAGGPNVPPGTVGDFGPIPTDGEIEIQQFYGSSNIAPVDPIAHFDDTTIVGDIVAWVNKISAATEFDLDVIIGDSGRLRRLLSGVGYVPGPGKISHFESKDAAPGTLTGNIDLRWFGRLRDLPDGADSYTLVSRDSNASGSRGTALFVQPNGTLFFAASTTGTGFDILAFSTVSILLDPDAPIGIRVNRSSVTGAIIFFTGTDFVGWTQLGTTINSVTGALFNNGLPVLVGAQFADDISNVLYGEARQLEISETLESPLQISMDTRDATHTQGRWFDSVTGAAWTPIGDAFVNVSDYDVLLGSDSVSMRTTALGAPSVVQPYTMFIVLKPTSETVFNIWTDGLSIGNRLSIFVNANLPQATAGATLVGPPISNEIIVIGINANGVTGKLAITGIADTLGDIGLEPWEFGTLFGNEGGTLFFDGWVGEILMFDELLSDQVFDDTMEALETKWIPEPLPPPMLPIDSIAHFDETSIVGSTPITAWNNLGTGGAAYDLIDKGLGIAADLVRSMENGLDVVQNTGFGQLAPAGAPTVNQPFTVFMVYNNEDITGTIINSKTQNVNRLNYRSANAGSWEFSLGTSLLLLVTSTAGLHLHTLVANTANSAHAVGANLRLGDVGIQFWEFASLFSNSAGGDGALGKMCELVVYDRLLSPIEKLDAEEFLNLKWGI